MKIDFLTLFPDMIRSYVEEAIMQRAQYAGVCDFSVHDIRDFSRDTHKNVDAPPYGGGAGMVMQVEPIHLAHQSVHDGGKKSRTILLSAKGAAFTQRDAERLTQYDQLIFICGRYEGVDERVAEHIADEEIAIGPYVLTGGELGAMVIADSVVRLLPGVLGNDQSAVLESHARDGYREHPHYTKPQMYNDWGVPDVLCSGDHAAIEQWRHEHSATDQK